MQRAGWHLSPCFLPNSHGAGMMHRAQSKNHRVLETSLPGHAGSCPDLTWSEYRGRCRQRALGSICVCHVWVPAHRGLW